MLSYEKGKLSFVMVQSIEWQDNCYIDSKRVADWQVIDSEESVYIMMRKGHRRRIKTEEKANVVAAVWGTEFIKFFATPAVLLKDDFKE